jgi:hypothetical protein
MKFIRAGPGLISFNEILVFKFFLKLTFAVLRILSCDPGNVTLRRIFCAF